MSTITFAASAPRPAATRLRLTARGRRVLLGLAALPLAIGIGVAALSGGSAIAGDDAVVTTFETVTVMPGETLWSLASEMAPGVDPRVVIDDIRMLNNLPSGMITVGQSIAVPTAYAG